MMHFCNLKDINYPFEQETRLYYNEWMHAIHFYVN